MYCSEISDRVSTSLDESVYTTTEEKSPSITDTVRSICDHYDTELPQLSSEELRLWIERDSIPVARVILLYSPDMLYIKWTRVRIENQGVATSIWKAIVENADRTVVAKPVSDGMKRVAEKLSFRQAKFNQQIVVQ